MKIKTIDVNALEWFDRINGNSYFAGTVTVNYAMQSEKTYAIPFQYGYGDSYQHAALNVLKENKALRDKYNRPLWKYCENNGIILRTTKHENCKKSELLNI